MTRPAWPAMAVAAGDQPGVVETQSRQSVCLRTLFVRDGQRWAHVDVYAWNDSDRPGKPAGGEAQGLRAAYALLKARAGR